MDSHLDVDVFISDIEERPSIWDIRSELYSDRGKKTEAWEELCLKHIPNFNEKSVAEKNKAAAQLQRKWKSLRDCFKREHAKQITTKSGSASSSRKPYMYYQQLSFLTNLTETRRGRSPVKNDGQNAMKRLKRMKINFEESQVENDILQNISEQLQSYKTNKHEDDSDRNFALSLVPHFKLIPSEFKLDAQADILTVLKKYKQHNMRTHGYLTPSFQESRSNSNLHPSTMGYQSSYQSENSPSTSSDNINCLQSDDSNSIIENLF